QTGDDRLFLPLVNKANTTAAPLGDTAVFQTLLPDPAALAAELRFSETQIQQVQAVVDAERVAIAALDADAAVVIDDTQKSLQEKQAAIAAMDYNGQLRSILKTSRDELQKQLGTTAYGQLVEWLNQEWQRLLNEFNTVRSGTNSASIAAADEPCPTFTVFATR